MELNPPGEFSKIPIKNGNGKKENSINNKIVFCRFISSSPISVILFC